MTRRIQTLGGLPVYDATEPLFIEVIPADVNHNRRKDPDRCAMAQACKRELHLEAKAYLSRLYVKHGDHWLRYQMPETVRAEVHAFDRGAGFTPGVYRIPPLMPSKRSGSPSRGNPVKTKTGTGARRTTQRKVEGVRAASPLAGGAIERVSSR